MDLKTYISAERGRATALAAKLVGVSPSYLSQMASGKSPISPERAAEIEVATDGVVTRKDLFPDNWEKIWPELAKEPPPRRATDPEPPAGRRGRQAASPRHVTDTVPEVPVTVVTKK